MVPSTSPVFVVEVMWRAVLFYGHNDNKDAEEGEVQWQWCDGIRPCRGGHSSSRGAPLKVESRFGTTWTGSLTRSREAHSPPASGSPCGRRGWTCWSTSKNSFSWRISPV